MAGEEMHESTTVDETVIGPTVDAPGVADESTILSSTASDGSSEVGKEASNSQPSEPRKVRVDAVRIQNFKKIVDTRLELGPITYLVGGNNSGKSSVLQAIHTAVSCAQASVEAKQKVVAEASLRYSPVAEFSLLGNGAPYDNQSQRGRRGIVEFEGIASDGVTEAEYRIEMYKARNHNNVGVEREGLSPGFGQIISDPTTLFSVYVPGLAGVPHREEMSGYAAVFRKAASGDANLVFRNIIRLLSDGELLPALEDLLESVLETPVSFRVTYDPARDLYVDVRLAAGEKPDPRDFLPVDLWGTGLLQITQIFAYVLLFRPAILLVDEPDSHLHPSRQKSLAKVLEQVSTTFGCKVLVSTHSRHLITGASEVVKVVWMQGGEVITADHRELTALLMDLGALDQFDKTAPKVILCTEDEQPRALEMARDALGFSEADVRIASFNGLENAQTAEAFRSMAELMDPQPRVIVHRDRDFLTADEVARWSETFETRGLEVFVTRRCDTEAYHATAEHIAAATDLTVEEATKLRNEVIDEQSASLREKLKQKRRQANKAYLDGGAPRTDDMWPEGEAPSDEVVYGKLLLTQLNVKLRKMQKLKPKDSLADIVSAELQAELEAALTESVETEG